MDPRARGRGERRVRLLPLPPTEGAEVDSVELANRLAPRGVGGLLDRAMSILRKELGLLFGISLAIWIPLRVLLLYQVRPMDVDPTLIVLIEQSLMTIGFVLPAAFAARVVAAQLARDGVDWVRVLALGPAEAVGLLSLTLAIGVASGVGICMCFIGVVAAKFWLALAPVVYVLELERKPFARIGYALQRSVSLVAGSFWRWLAIATILMVLHLLLTLPVGYLDDPGERLSFALRFGVDLNLLELLVALLGAVFLALVGVLNGVVFAAFYFDQRARLEGVDLYLNLAWLEEQNGGPA